MDSTYEDNPNSNLEYLHNLKEEELTLYVKGYIQACIHVREAFNKGQVELLTEIMSIDDDEYLKADMLHSVDVLDAFEFLVRRKESTLLRMFPEISVNSLESPSSTQ